VIGQFEVAVVKKLPACAEVCRSMDSFEDQLSEAVRQYEHLYNTSIKTDRDMLMAKNSWKEIARTLCTEEGVCRKRWRYLRDKFATAKRRLDTKTSGAPGGRAWIPALYTSLQCLDAHIKHGATTTNITVSQVEVSSGADQIVCVSD